MASFYIALCGRSQANYNPSAQEASRKHEDKKYSGLLLLAIVLMLKGHTFIVSVEHYESPTISHHILEHCCR